MYKNGSDLLHCALQCVPSTVGGLPIIHLHNFFVRAESDLLTGFIGLDKHAEKIDHPIAPVLRRFLEIPRDTSVTKAMLLNDPYSLPLYRPKSPAVKLKRIMARKLIHASIKDIKELLRLLEDSSVKDLVTVLDTGKYWWAKLFSALYDASPMALAEKLINQFLSAKSIMDTFLVAKTSRRRAEKFLKDAIRQDHVVNLWRYQTLKGETPKKNREQY